MSEPTTQGNGDAGQTLAPVSLLACVKCGGVPWLRSEGRLSPEMHYECCGVWGGSLADEQGALKAWNGKQANNKVSDGGPLTHESKQDANPPFTAPLG